MSNLVESGTKEEVAHLRSKNRFYVAGWVANTSGENNSAHGFASLYNNTTGSFNSAFGRGALGTNTTGSNNTAIGKWAMVYNQSGSSNTSLGFETGANNLTGSGNVFIGYQAGYNETGSNKLYIDNSNTSTPLIHGDFDTNKVNKIPDPFLKIL